MGNDELTVSLFSGDTSIMPRNRFWHSGGTKCGMWKTPRFTWTKKMFCIFPLREHSGISPKTQLKNELFYAEQTVALF
jgi:hypothetical protein